MAAFRPPTRDDVDAIVAIAVACDIEDFGAPDYDRDALLDEWAEPGVDLERDGFLTEGAYGLVLGTDARAWVHPDVRGRGLGTALAERLEARARELGRPHLAQQIGTADAAGRALLEGRGYAFAHAFAALTLDDSAVSALPLGGGVRAYEPGDEAAAQDLLERAFAEGGGRIEPLDVLRARNPDTALWFVADAPDGSLAGAVRAELRAAGLLAGQLTAVAVEPAHRSAGIGGQLIGAASRALVDAGAMTIRLHVRSSNPDALRLYERLGFSGRWLVDELRLAF